MPLLTICVPLVLLLLISSDLAYGSLRTLFLVEGCPAGDDGAYGSLKFAAVLHKLERDRLESVREILAGSEGASAIVDYPDQRRVVLIPGSYYGRLGGMRIPIVDMEEPERERFVSVSIGEEEAVSTFHLTEEVEGGPKLLFRVRREMESVGYIAVQLSSGDQQPASPEDYRDVQVTGVMGIGLAYNDFLRISLREDGLLQYWSAVEMRGIPLRFPPIPGDDWEGGRRASMFVRNAYISAVVPSLPRSELKKIETTDVWILLSGNKEWQRFTLPGSRISARGFGAWIGGYASFLADSDSAGQANRDHPRRNCVPFWRKAQAHSLQLPGLLYLLNTKTGDLITWETDEADSEIILVDASNVIYRVGTGLYQAQLRDDSITIPELLIDSETILDIHWAFYGPARPEQDN